MRIYILSTHLASTLESVRSTIVNGKLSSIMLVATALACFFCALSLLRFANDYVGGRGTEPKSVLYPLLMVVLCMHFNTFVASPIHSLTNLFARRLETVSAVDESKIDSFLSERLELAKEAVAAAHEESKKKISSGAVYEFGENFDNNDPMWREKVTKNWNPTGFFGTLGKGAVKAAVGLVDKSVGRIGNAAINTVKSSGSAIIQEVEDIFYAGFFFVLECALKYLIKVVHIWLTVQCYFSLTFLTLIGPLVFAISIFESFRVGLVRWLEQYIQTALWLPVLNIVMYICYEMIVAINSMPVGMGKLSMDFINCVLFWLTIRNMFATPSFASKIIETSGFGDLAEGGLKSVGGFFARRLF